ncbi:hypothetical protein M2419_003474 [Sphingobacterium sp. BIGb0116]|nr:hypothetical protein [Sphingobacterium sp. BIGb0116]
MLNYYFDKVFVSVSKEPPESVELFGGSPFWVASFLYVFLPEVSFQIFNPLGLDLIFWTALLCVYICIF